MVIRALIREPRILFLDEHTSYVDVTKTKVIQNMLKKYCDKHPECTVLAITHFNDQLDFYNRIITISKGKIIKDEVETHH